MARMKAIEAAVAVLKKEGVHIAFGVPGAAINPMYAAMKALGGIEHVLARHVEGASHMAEGFTRTDQNNIGVCIGTSGPAGTDMITGLYSASADSIPILCITGQAPRARLHKEDFQAVDIESIAKPVTKWATTVLEPAQVPRAFQKAFHIMRSGRPGPVLIDLPLDVQLAEIEFDIDSYEPLAAFKPSASREQVEKALDMLAASEKPVIVSGGGVINAGASDLLQQFAELTGVPVIPTLMGWALSLMIMNSWLAWLGYKQRIVTVTRRCLIPILCLESVTALPIDIRGLSTFTLKAESLFILILNPRRLAVCSVRISVLFPMLKLPLS